MKYIIRQFREFETLTTAQKLKFHFKVALEVSDGNKPFHKLHMDYIQTLSVPLYWQMPSHESLLQNIPGPI